MKKLGYYLKQKRKVLMLLQDEVANKLGISRVRYVEMENDKVFSYSPKTLKAVAEFLGKDAEWVLKRIPRKDK